MTNTQVRQWYKDEVGRISSLNLSWIAKGEGAERRARKAWQMRHTARLKARDMMENPEEVQLLRKRDLAKYGNSDGPTFEYLVDYWSRFGLQGDKIYEAIIEDALITNAEVDRKFRID
ncbi:MAG TPA: hypothetical protein VI306_23535 [Pyrinomonadaceae bacterium]